MNTLLPQCKFRRGGQRKRRIKKNLADSNETVVRMINEYIEGGKLSTVLITVVQVSILQCFNGQ